ncbi:YeeE/YedE family protein [Microvenator marinus]|jgi:uncharacterized membrane protein YedE/YeeE|uniref:YeeE/YedE family protein n=1 Tax=Microvenator marinus TaxID=2600177 RepID=A0A5B8Y2B9_9DELT|nr:YeeE/YedE thiosulfate transporter family protein [Microvenator marinus]QED29839.1 YeeE/YedE family protein [Microvenator marinus]
MEVQTWITAALGGGIIGLASALLLAFNGRIAGISGITGGLISPTRGEVSWRLMFLIGLLGGGFLMALLMPEAFTASPRSTFWVVAAGLLVGFGTRLGSGCTSGHGVCGLSRFSPRSLVATLTFIGAGMVTVALFNGFGG